MPNLYDTAAACGPMDPEEEEKETDKAQEGVEELVSQVAQVVENVQETITDASKEVQSLIFPEVSIQESSTTVGSSFEGESTTLSDKSWKKELNGYRLTGQTSDIRLNTTNDDISVDPSIETIENEGDILIGFDHHVRTGVVKENEKKKQRQKSLVDPYQMSLDRSMLNHLRDNVNGDPEVAKRDLRESVVKIQKIYRTRTIDREIRATQRLLSSDPRKISYQKRVLKLLRHDFEFRQSWMGFFENVRDVLLMQSIRS